MTKVQELKNKFSSLYYKGVNEALSPLEDEAVRKEFREVEDSLMGLMEEQEFQDFYSEVHKMAWTFGSQEY